MNHHFMISSQLDFFVSHKTYLTDISKNRLLEFYDIIIYTGFNSKLL